MDKSTAVCFGYAKAAGLLRKAFVKDRARLLFEQESLADLWTLLFKQPAPLVPETLLARQIEERAFSNFLSIIFAFSSNDLERSWKPLSTSVLDLAFDDSFI